MSDSFEAGVRMGSVGEQSIDDSILGNMGNLTLKGLVGFIAQTITGALNELKSALTGKAPLPQWVVLNSGGDGVAMVLPAGGTWAYFLIIVSSSTGGVTANSSVAGVAAGGTTIGIATGSHQWTGFGWRIAS